jgi:hypothetical protein
MWYGVKVKGKKQKREQAGLENRLFPLKLRRRGKDLVMKLNPFPPERRRKVLNSLYIINIKKVLISN